MGYLLGMRVSIAMYKFCVRILLEFDTPKIDEVNQIFFKRRVLFLAFLANTFCWSDLFFTYKILRCQKLKIMKEIKNEFFSEAFKVDQCFLF